MILELKQAMFAEPIRFKGTPRTWFTANDPNDRRNIFPNLCALDSNTGIIYLMRCDEGKISDEVLITSMANCKEATSSLTGSKSYNTLAEFLANYRGEDGSKSSSADNTRVEQKKVASNSKSG